MSIDSVRFSVIIPAYNVEQYIAAALDSVFAQLVPADEIIVVDDGSTDATAEVLDQYANRPGLRVISTENQGQGLARNIGLAHATGHYIYFLDADDLVSRYLLQTAAERIADSQPDVILFSGDSFHDDGSACDKSDYIRPFEANGLTGDEAVAQLVQAGTPSPSPCLYISKRSVWQDNQIQFKDIIHEDDEIFVRLILAASFVTIIEDILFHRRVRAGSTMSSGLSGKNVRGLFAASSTLAQVYKESPGRPESTRRAVRKRAIRTAQRYMRVCRKVGVKPDTRRMLSYAVMMRSIDLALGACVHAVVCNSRKGRPECGHHQRPGR